MTGKSFGKKVEQARRKLAPRLSREEFLQRVNDSGFSLDDAGLKALEAGELRINYFQITVLASVLNTTVRELIL